MIREPSDQSCQGMQILSRRYLPSSGSITQPAPIVLTYFTAVRDETLTRLSAYRSGTQSAGVVTAKFGVYSVVGDPQVVDGDLTLIAATANDPTIFSTSTVTFIRSTLAPYDLAAGGRYAMAILQVATTTGQLMGNNIPSSISGVLPRIAGTVNAPDLPQIIKAVDIGPSGLLFTGVLLP